MCHAGEESPVIRGSVILAFCATDYPHLSQILPLAAKVNYAWLSQCHDTEHFKISLLVPSTLYLRKKNIWKPKPSLQVSYKLRNGTYKMWHELPCGTSTYDISDTKLDNPGFL